MPDTGSLRRNSASAVIAAAALAILGAAAGCGSGTTNGQKSPAPSATTAPQTSPQPTQATASQTSPSAAPPSETATPSASPSPTSVTYTGAGSKVLRISKSNEPMAVTITHTGTSNFVVTNLDASGQEINLLVNTIGDYHGTRLIDALEEEHTAALKIEADGTWTVTLKSLSLLPVWDGAGAWTGHGDNLLLLKPGSFTGLAVVKITNSGEGNFVVTAYGENVDLLVNEIGNYSGEQQVPSGTVLLEVESDGTWTLRKV